MELFFLTQSELDRLIPTKQAIKNTFFLATFLLNSAKNETDEFENRCISEAVWQMYALGVSDCIEKLTPRHFNEKHLQSSYQEGYGLAEAIEGKAVKRCKPKGDVIMFPSPSALDS